jgi:hypothetical protein
VREQLRETPEPESPAKKAANKRFHEVRDYIRQMITEMECADVRNHFQREGQKAATERVLVPLRTALTMLTGYEPPRQHSPSIYAIPEDQGECLRRAQIALLDLQRESDNAGAVGIYEAATLTLSAMLREICNAKVTPKPKQKQKYRIVARYLVDCLVGIEEAESYGEAYAQYRCRYGDKGTDALQLEIYRQTGHNARLDGVFATVEEK